MSKDTGIVIKKIKKVSGGGHHGGAWKVAYADFVTAMMAFFLLLWLLNATEAENLAGLADYFAPTVGIKDALGVGFRGGKAALSEGIGADKNTNKGIVSGGVPTGPITKVIEKIEERTDEEDSKEKLQVLIDNTKTSDQTEAQDEQARPQEVGGPGQSSGDGDEKNDAAKAAAAAKQAETEQQEQKLQKAVNTMVDDMAKDKRIEEGSVAIKRTPEGVMIEIKDVSGNSMFENNSPLMKDRLKEALIQLTKILKNIPNNLAVVGHTSSVPVQSKDPNYTKWELSSDRANATRVFLEKNGVQAEQFSRIEGRADNVPYDTRKPESPVNNRINIIILKQSDTPGHKKSAPESLFINMKDKKTTDFIKDTSKKADTKTDEKNAKKKVDQDVKDIIKNTSETQKEADDAKKTGTLPTDAINNDLIDLNKNDKVEPEEKPEQKNNLNQGFEKLLKESEATREQAGAAKKTGKIPDNVINKDLPDLDATEKPVTEKKTKPQADLNQNFKNILEDSAKSKQAKSPAKNTGDSLPDLSADPKDATEDKKPAQDNKNINQDFLNILNETQEDHKQKPPTD